MQSTTLPTYPFLYKVQPIKGIVYEAHQLSRPHPKIRAMPEEEVRKHQRSESAAAATQHSTPAAAHHRDKSAPIPRHDETRKGHRQKRVTVSGLLQTEDGNGPTFRVVTAQSLGTNTHPPPLTFESETRVDEQAEKNAVNEAGSNPPTTLAPGEKKHGAYCRVKKVFKSIFSRHHGKGPATSTTTNDCKHKFRKGQCKSCGHAQVEPVEDSGLRPGFYCSKRGCAGCASCSTTELRIEEEEQVFASCVAEDAPQIAPLLPVSKLMPAFTIEDTLVEAADDYDEHDDDDEDDDLEVSRISEEAPQLAPTRSLSSFTNEVQDVITPVDDDSGSDEASQVLTTFSEDPWFSSSPTRCPSESSSTCSEPWPQQRLDTPTPCPTRLVAAQVQGALASTAFESYEHVADYHVLEEDVPATALQSEQACCGTDRRDMAGVTIPFA